MIIAILSEKGLKNVTEVLFMILKTGFLDRSAEIKLVIKTAILLDLQIL